MPIPEEIALIVESLRKSIAENNINAEEVREATRKLAKIGYEYDSTRFPSLPEKPDWGSISSDAPQTLAEALLWKMGKWKVYQSFASHFSDEASQSKGTDVIFFAFAKHLRARENPIYDQHALRALWAVDSAMTQDQASICSSVLVSKGQWKAIARGRYSVAAYELYLGRIKKHCSHRNGPSPEFLDRFLMPLGQAIKAHVKPATLAKWCGASY